MTNQGAPRQCSAVHQAAGSGHRALGRTSRAAETGRVTMVSPSAIGAVAARPRRPERERERGEEGGGEGHARPPPRLVLPAAASPPPSQAFVPPNSATRTLGKTTPAAAAQDSRGVRAAGMAAAAGWTGPEVGVVGGLVDAGGDRAKPLAGWVAWAWMRPRRWLVTLQGRACPPWPGTGRVRLRIGGPGRGGGAAGAPAAPAAVRATAIIPPPFFVFAPPRKKQGASPSTDGRGVGSALGGGREGRARYWRAGQHRGECACGVSAAGKKTSH